MSGFDATLKELCAGTASLEAALTAFHRERPDDRTVLLHFRQIESAWRAGKLERKSYDVLREAALARSAGLVSAAHTRPQLPMTDAVITARPVPAGSERDASASMEVRAEGRTMPYTREPKHRAAPSSHSARGHRSDSAAASHLTDPSQWPHEASEPLGPGSMLKQRFVLEQIIGRGGMGTIYRARDLRKEEAQDRHPYVAVKVLNEDFRRHPEALISLQREARKAQTLAHPNVATVYDFDRDGPVVFLVMELLEGMSLDEFTKSRVGRPLPGAEALRIVRSLGAALAHAHQKGLVHADFKPANAFRTHDGTVKVLDFGIARAIGRRVHDGEHTVFDPASLGALTPCYASPEMLVGDVPDQRDDVFALACVAYELFCSRHPFDFISSQLAERRGLKPAPIPGLDRRIWRALVHGLAFSRDSRTSSVEAFLQEMAPARSFSMSAIAAGLVAAVALGLVSWNMLPKYLNDRTQARYTAELQSGDPIVIEALLPQLLQLPALQRQTLLNDPAARDALIQHAQGKIGTAIDPAKEHFDFDQAMRAVDQLELLLPDASAAQRLRAHIEDSRKAVLANYLETLNQQLKRGWLIDAQNSQNALRTIAKVRRIDSQWQPDRNLLEQAFITQTRLALTDKKDLATAAALIAAGKGAGVSDPEFAQLDASLASLQQRLAKSSQPAPEQPPLAAVPGAPTTSVPSTTVPTVSPSVAANAVTSNAAAAPAASPAVQPQPAVPAVTAKPQPALTMEQRQDRLLALAAVDDLTGALELLRDLQSDLPADDPFLTTSAPDALAKTYIRLSARAFDSGEFESAAALLMRAAEFNPDAPEIAARRESVDRVAHVAHTLEFVISFSVERVIAELEHIEVNEGQRFPLIRTQLAEILAQRIDEAQATAPQRATELLAAARRIFPGSPVFANLQPTQSSFIAGP